MMPCKASIIIRAYNAAETIERAIESGLRQDLAPEAFRIIVVNDGSKDATPAVLRRYEGRPNVRVIHQTNQGGTAAALRGLAEVDSEYFTLLDSDDAFEPELLSELTAELDAQPGCQFVYPDYFEVLAGERKVVSPRHLLETVAIGILYRTAWVQQHGFYRDGFYFAEYELLLRHWERWRGLHYGAKPLFTYYRRPDSSTGNPEFLRAGRQQLLEAFPDKIELINMIRGY